MYAVVPTDQNTFFDKAPFLRITDEYIPVVSVDTVWKTHRDVVIFLASSTIYPSWAIVKYPCDEQYTPAGRASPDSSLLVK